MSDYAQESGRPGRGSRRSEAFAMRSIWIGRDRGVKKDEVLNLKPRKNLSKGVICSFWTERWMVGSIG